MSNSLTDVYDQISAQDAVYLEKHAEQIKIAEEEDAAGRIMARGFADELHKLSMPMKGKYGAGDGYGPTGGGKTGEPTAPAKLPKPPRLIQPPPGSTGAIVKTKPGFDMGPAGKMGPGGTGPITKRRPTKGPKVPNIGNAPAGQFGKGKTVTPGGEIK